METKVRQCPENINGQRVKGRPVSTSGFNDWTMWIALGHWVTFTESISHWTSSPRSLGGLLFSPHGWIIASPELCLFLVVLSWAQLPLSSWPLCCVFWEAQRGVYPLTLAPGLVTAQPQHERATAAKCSYCITERRVATSLWAVQPKGDRLIPIGYWKFEDSRYCSLKGG